MDYPLAIRSAAAASLLIVASIELGRDHSPLPTDPTLAPPRTVTAIAIASTSSPLAINQVAQLRATAVFNDGGRRDVTASTAWTTSNDSVANVSTAGLITAVSTGAADIT